MIIHSRVFSFGSGLCAYRDHAFVFLFPNIREYINVHFFFKWKLNFSQNMTPEAETLQEKQTASAGNTGNREVCPNSQQLRIWHHSQNIALLTRHQYGLCEVQGRLKTIFPNPIKYNCLQNKKKNIPHFIGIRECQRHYKKLMNPIFRSCF